MLGEEKRCKYKYCNEIIVAVAGHRKREYCKEAHRQAAHRERIAEARLEQDERDRQARIEQARAAFLKRYGNLLPGTLDLLQSLQSASLAEKIVKAIRAEQELVHQTEEAARSAVIEDLLLTGEQIGYPSLINDDFVLDAGVESWLTFIESESLEQLYLARDIVQIKLRAANGRKRLTQLVPQT